MYDYMMLELTDQETEDLIEKAANEIIKRKMEVPAVIMLEMHKPISYIASQASVVFAPFIIPLVGYDNANNYSRLLTKRENVEKLIRRLEVKQAANAATNREAQLG